MAHFSLVAPLAGRSDLELEPHYTAGQVAAALRISKGAVHLAERSGELRGAHFGRSVRFAKSAVDAWIAAKNAR